MTKYRCLLLSWTVPAVCSFHASPYYLIRSQSHPKHQQQHTLLYTAAKKSFASISSDGTVSRAPRSAGSLGNLSSRKQKKQSQKMSKKERQRTGNGTIQSESTNDGKMLEPAEQGVQVVSGNRGNKTVTIIRGMNATPIAEKKKILKMLKSKLGVGGTLVDGVLEVQGGSHAEKVVEILKGLGYLKARKIGK